MAKTKQKNTDVPDAQINNKYYYSVTTKAFINSKIWSCFCFLETGSYYVPLASSELRSIYLCWD